MGMRYCRPMIRRAHAGNRNGFDEALVAQALQAALALPRETPVFAISGVQGSGKSTLAEQIAALARARGKCAAVLSIDDFYLTAAARQRLARSVHPLLATRGPPGTHDLALALDVVQGLREGRSTRLPRFDKLADERLPMTQWPQLRARCDLIVLEGWFLKTPAQHAQEMQPPLNALERDQDTDSVWRTWCNQALARDYPALWSTLDALWLLQAPGFDIVPDWRWQQEQALHAAQPERRSMNRAEVDRFAEFFERVSRQALRTLPAIADRTIKLDAHRRPGT